MFNFFKPSENENLQAAIDYVTKFSPNHTVLVKEKKKNTWIIVLISFILLATVGVLAYLFFFKDTCDCFDDFDDFDDDDYDEVFDIDEDNYDE